MINIWAERLLFATEVSICPGLSFKAWSGRGSRPFGMMILARLIGGTNRAMTQALLAPKEASLPPRSIGALKIATKSVGKRSGLDRFRTSGSMKVAFPRTKNAVEGIMVNTSGGLTGGDRFETQAIAGQGSHLMLTTQAAERAYRSAAGQARVNTHLTVETDARLHWLPQEFILFDGASVSRRLTIDLHADAELVLVEPVVFGRRAMNEVLTTGHFQDRIDLRRNGKQIYLDQINLSGAISNHLEKPAIAGGMTAMASLIFHGARADALVSSVRSVLPKAGGATLMQSGLLVVRILAADSFLLRRSMIPVLELLTGNSLPKSWSL